MTPATASLGDPVGLLGEWLLSRVVEERQSGERSRVEGRLALVADAPDRIRWEEHGVWHRASGTVEVRRSLWIVRVAETGAWWVRFEDGRDFHPWTPGVPVVHPCGADTYRGAVSGTPQRWTIDWDVTGPTKDYAMWTELSACAARPHPATGPAGNPPPAGS